MRICHCHRAIQFTDSDRCDGNQNEHQWRWNELMAGTDVSLLLFFIKFDTMFRRKLVTFVRKYSIPLCYYIALMNLYAQRK